MSEPVTILGGGLAGCEAAWQLAERGCAVRLYEMRPSRVTAAHVTDRLAELVCSNSLGSVLPDRALGLLKNELLRLGSLLMRVAFRHAVPAGQALAVSRDEFAAEVTERITSHPKITVMRNEFGEIPSGPAIIATGPLTSPSLSARIVELTGRAHLYFYDAMAPIIEADSIDMGVAFRQSRWDVEVGPKGEGDADGDYINCPLDEPTYRAFVAALKDAPKVPLPEFEQELKRYFEGCMPIEVLAARGEDALAFGPMRPVGLLDPRTGRRPFAVVQLRQDDLAGRLYNMVGFQTNLLWGAQQEVLRRIPGLEAAEFVRLGQMHRNTFIDSPQWLEPTLRFKGRERLYFAGQITGTEGYVGSTLGGLLAGVNLARELVGQTPMVLPRESMSGALLHYITHCDSKRFQPMKANLGLLPGLLPSVRKAQRTAMLLERARTAFDTFATDHGFPPAP